MRQLQVPLKGCVVHLVPFLRRLLNASLSAAVLPAAFKSAYICQLIKKPDLDTADVKNLQVAGEAGRSAAALLVVSQQAAARLAICLSSRQVH